MAGGRESGSLCSREAAVQLPGLVRSQVQLGNEETPEAFWDAIGRAKKVFTDRKAWEAIMGRAMKADFSWPAAAEKYEKVYKAVAKHLPKKK